MAVSQRRKPLAYHCPLTHRGDVIGTNEIFNRLTTLKLSFMPI
ncbi:MAG: hypothetical protein R3F47_07615 [Gammaproteobacteria bacterium]